jgi:hypothetical protein
VVVLPPPVPFCRVAGFILVWGVRSFPGFPLVDLEPCDGALARVAAGFFGVFFGCPPIANDEDTVNSKTTPQS